MNQYLRITVASERVILSPKFFKVYRQFGAVACGPPHRRKKNPMIGRTRKIPHCGRQAILLLQFR